MKQETQHNKRREKMKNQYSAITIDGINKKAFTEKNVLDFLEGGIIKVDKIALNIEWNPKELKMITTISNGDSYDTTFEIDKLNFTAFVVFENTQKHNISNLTKAICNLIKGIEILV